MEGRKREGVRRMEGSEVVCSVRVWYHLYASPVHPEMCDNWLLKTHYFTIVWEACCVHGQPGLCYLGCTVSTNSELPGLSLLNTVGRLPRQRHFLSWWKNSVAITGDV